MPLRAHFRGGDWLPLSCLRGARFRGWAFPVARCGSVLILLSADNVLPTADDRGLSAGIRLICRAGSGRRYIFSRSRSSRMASKFSSAHPISAVRWGMSDSPRGVSAYSTRGGTSGYRCEHLLRDVGRPAVDFRKTQAPARMEVVEYQQRPLVPEAVDDMADRAVGIGRVCGFFHVRSGRSFFPYSTYNTSPLRYSPSGW